MARGSQKASIFGPTYAVSFAVLLAASRPSNRPILQRLDTLALQRYPLETGNNGTFITCFAMRLALQTDFALRTLIYLAARPARANIADVADFYAISRDHVAKVVQQLARHGFIRSIRGVGGGIQLARPAETISVGDVIAAFEGNMHLLDCVAIENVCVIQPGCKLRRVLAEAERLQSDYLRTIRLSDVVAPGEQFVDLGITIAANPT
jgi:Rrf2 family nitric oxide-sensitive transcriptional repressor